jgi:dTMP kinase
MAEKLKKGLFITFEGPEGCGKSTQSDRMASDLKRDGYSVVYTREPGGTGLGMRIREILLEKESIALSDKAELLLFEADRAQHVDEVIRPALNAGKIVLCDRFNTATFAYQGHGLGMDMEMIKDIDFMARGGVNPDLVIVLDVEVEVGLKRAAHKGGLDRMEKRGADFHRRVREGYLACSKKYPALVKVVGAARDKEAVYKDVREIVHDLLKKHTGTA